MEEAQNRPDGESERWKWLWKVVPWEERLREEASMGCTFNCKRGRKRTFSITEFNNEFNI